MRLRFSTVSAALISAFLLVLLTPASFSAEPPWLQINSAHYTVITDAGEKKGREVAFRFEQMRAVFAGLFGKDHLHQSIPLTILALDNDKPYYQVAPLHNGQPIEVPGFFLPGPDQDFIVLNMSESDPWRAVAHDFARMLLTYNYPPAQAWFDRGLTSYFSSIRLDNRQVEMGRDPESARSAENSASDLLRTQPWLSLDDLFTAKSEAFSGKEGPLYNAQSWVVLHYLLHEKKLPETGAYFDFILNQHLPIEDAVQRAYGMSPAQLEQAVKEYFQSWPATGASPAGAAASQDSPQINRFPTPVSPDDSAITSKTIAESEVRATYAGVQIRIAERRELGLKTLNDLANTRTSADQKAEARQTKRTGEDEEQLPTNSIGNPVAHRILAWDHIEHGEFDEAFAELRDAAALNPGDMWIRYYLSLAKYRTAQAKHSDVPGLANMMLDLRSVLEWYPDMANAYDLLAMARTAGGSPSSALQSERAAMGLSPRNEVYVLHLAQIYVASKKWDSANALLERLKTSGNPDIVAQANDLLSQASAQRKYGIPLDGKGASQLKYAPQKSPFDVLEEDEAKREAAESEGTSAEKHSMKFVRGRLLAVDCTNPPAAVVTIRSDAGVLKLHTADYKTLLLIGADDFSCDWRDVEVDANYKPGGGTSGDLVSLEVR